MKYHVVIQTAFIGDVFLSIPFLQTLRRIYPDHKIIYVAKKGVAQALYLHGLIDLLVEVKKSDSQSYTDAIKQINAYTIDHVFCLHRSFRSAWFAFKIHAFKRVGFKTGLWSFLFHESVPYPQIWPDAIRQISLLQNCSPQLKNELRQIDWTEYNFKNSFGKFPEIPVQFQMKGYKDSQDHALTTPSSQKKNISSTTSKKIALFPGSVWASKKWTTEGYAALAKNRIDQGDEVYLLGGPDELKDAEEILALEPRLISFVGQKSLIESIAFIRDCDLVVCNDSSPSHLAAFTSTPTVTIFGPTTLKLGFRPWNNRSQVVEVNDLDCRPCGKHGHQKCPLGHHRCMKDISVQDVISAIESLKLPH